MALKKKSTVSPLVPIGTLLERYSRVMDEKKTIEAELKKLSEEIKEAAEKTGVKDDRGSYYASTDNFVYGKVAKKSVSFDEAKAIAFVKSHGFNDCVRTIEVLDESAVESRVNSGDITYDELEGITVTKVTYAVDVKPKEEMPEVEEYPVAAKRRGREANAPRL